MKKIVLIFILNILIFSTTYAKHQYEEYSIWAFWNYLIKGSDNYYQFQSDLIQDKDVIKEIFRREDLPANLNLEEVCRHAKAQVLIGCSA